MRRLSCPRRRQRALTLIELLVTITLIGIVTTAIVMGSGAVTGSRMRGGATMIIGAIRIAYTRASATSRTNRLAFDLEAGTVSLEETSDTMLVRKDDATGGSEASTPEERAAIELAARVIKGPQAPRARFSAVKALGFDDPDTSGGRSLGKGVKFRKIETGHAPDGQTTGKAYLYFWPGGQTERASIQLMFEGSQSTDDGLSLLVAPLTGRVRTMPGSKSMDPLRDDGTASERGENVLRARGFTLLEVMVAVAILGLSLTVILSAQAGLYSGGAYAQHTSVAIGLARCRMTEVEERLLKLGYPEVDQKDDGACCDDDTRQDMRCEWKIERVELPQAKPPDLAPSGSASPLGLGSSAFGGTPGSGSTPASPLTTLTQIAANPAGFAGDAGVSSIASALKDGTGGMAGLEAMAMSFVYPQLKIMLEASIRKVTVKVAWHEGIQNRDITVVQYVTRPMRSDMLSPVGSASGQVPQLPPTGGLGSGINPLRGMP